MSDGAVAPEISAKITFVFMPDPFSLRFPALMISTGIVIATVKADAAVPSAGRALVSSGHRGFIFPY